MSINKLSGTLNTTDLVLPTGRNNPAWMGWFTSLWDRVSSLITQANKIVYGTGSPEGVVVASVGTIFINENGGTSFTMWVKEVGDGPSGWVAK